MLSGVSIITVNGQHLFTAPYCADFDHKAIKEVCTRCAERGILEKPFVRRDNTTVFYKRMGDMYLLGSAKGNVDMAVAVGTLSKLVECLETFLGVEAESLSKNDILNEDHLLTVWQVLNKSCSNGHPTLLEPDMLLPLIAASTPKRVERKRLDRSSSVSNQITGTIPWRNPELLHSKYGKQEFFLTVREVLNILCSPSGQVLSGQVEGHIEAVCHLNGMPDCKMGVNDRVTAAPAPQRTSAREQPELEGASFHQCVKLHKYSEDREIQFVPPDGEFELMQYRISSGVQVPFRVQSTLKQHGRARTELTVQLRSLYPAKCIAMKVKLFVPLPPNFQKYDNATMTGGWMKPGTQDGCLVWKARDLEGQKELQLNLTLHNLSSTSDQVWDKPPIKVYFELPGWTASGLKVTFLRILERSHSNVSKCRKYVRYHSHSGQFDVRMA